VKFDCRFHIRERIFIRLAFADNTAFQSQWVGHVTIRMFFDDHLE
jgi:hypothetical protein